MSILIALALLALLSSTSASTARAQTATNVTSSEVGTARTSAILIFSSISESNTSITSEPSYSSTWASSSFASATSTSETTESSVATSTATATSTNLTLTSTTSAMTSATSTISDPVTVTVTSTTTSEAAFTTFSSVTDSADYSISFSPQYWFCTGISVTFTGPLVESGLYGDTLQFQYFQYNPGYPSVLVLVFTDSGLTVTSDTVNYWISPSEYAQINFAYQPNIAVKVVDLTSKWNGYTSGLLYMGLTGITPEGGQYCQYDSPPIPAPEFPTAATELLLILASMGLSLAFLKVHRRYGPSK